MISCHLSHPSPLPPPPPLLPQRKPTIQSGAEIRSIGAWPGSRALANEVGERQAKSLPLGLYCLYRGLVIGGYGGSIKRLLPQPLRRVRHFLPPPLPPLAPPLIPPSLSHLCVLFKMKRNESLLIGVLLVPAFFHRSLPCWMSCRCAFVFSPGCRFNCVLPCLVVSWLHHSINIGLLLWLIKKYRALIV